MICNRCKIDKIYFYGKSKICKECYNKSQLCIHNIRKSRCKNCYGISICEHNIQKQACKTCNGNQICIHKKQKTKCKECNGNGICEHNKDRYKCKECNGTGICEHNREKYNCKECNGSGICEHNKVKYICRECNGKGICEHEKIKYQCITCSPKIACYNCKHMIRSKIYKPYCFMCYCVLNPDIKIKKRYKTKELLLSESLKKMNLGVDFIQDKKIDGGCSRRRPDFLFDLLTHTIIVECDENNHRDYNITCEIAKLNETFTDLADRPMILIRFNPDKCKENGKSCFDRECKLIIKEWNRRIKILKKELEKSIRKIPVELITIKYLF